MAWTAPRTWVSGEVVTAALLNTHLRDQFLEIGNAWVSWAPTLSNITVGNGIQTAYYRQVNKTVHFRYWLQFGSTSAIGSGSNFTLPVAPAAAVAHTVAGALLDSSAADYRAGAAYIVASGSLCLPLSPTGRLTGTVPWTWATGDEIAIGGTYEAA